MKPSLCYFIIAIMLLTASSTAVLAANSCSSYDVILTRQISVNDNSELEDDDEGHRVPARPVRCTISTETGVMLSGYSVGIVRYDIWNPDGDLCLFTTSDESSFVEEILSAHGTFMIRLYSDAYIFTGYVSIP